MSEIQIIKVIEDLRSVEWKTLFGWCIYSIFLFFISASIILTIKSFGINLESYTLLGLLLILQIIHSVIWFIKRTIFYDPEIITIGFAITPEESSKDYYKEIKKKFKENLSLRKLSKFLKIIELPTDLKFEKDEDAEKFILQKDIRVLIWGNTTEAMIDNAPFTQFNVKFSYQHGVIDPTKRKKFVEDIDVAAQRKYWGIWRPQSYYGLIVVSGNILEISLFIFGICLATIPQIKYLLRAVEIFEALEIILKERRKDENFPNLPFVKQKVRNFLRDAYTILQIFYWQEYKDLSKATEFAKKAIKFDENNFLAHQNLAIFKWLNGDKEGAKFHTNRAWKIKPGHPLPRFNFAFFYMWDKQFDLALKEYKKIQYAGETNTLDVAEFLYNEYEKTPENFGLLFASGWVNINFADQVRGILQLQEFLNKTKSLSEYKTLNKEAEIIINNIQHAS